MIGQSCRSGSILQFPKHCRGHAAYLAVDWSSDLLPLSERSHLTDQLKEDSLMALTSGDQVQGRPGANMPPLNLAGLRSNLQEKFYGKKISERDVLSAALYPQVFDAFM